MWPSDLSLALVHYWLGEYKKMWPSDVADI